MVYSFENVTSRSYIHCYFTCANFMNVVFRKTYYSHKIQSSDFLAGQTGTVQVPGREDTKP